MPYDKTETTSSIRYPQDARDQMQTNTEFPKTVNGCLKKQEMHFSIRNSQGLPARIQTNSPITEDTHGLERI